ncbi:MULTISPECIES: hypothetical protein [Nostocales]|uniref:Uncharacterized protein n=2 Tax=Nostocales TaxID=1161 RepID=A0A8S9T2A2_9CYAN|nr:hypothetical protein [Tolypothrix bouteillei]KAF3886550.1 hypothetical protein DA73_0400014490 [Tolypothrix bouteillei VB521301]
MTALSFKFITHNAFLRKIAYKIKIRRPGLPNIVGMPYYQKYSSWELDTTKCPCDIEFVEYMKESKTEGKSILHFGTGVHHIIGLENQKLTQPNEIIGITASEPEHQAYVRLALKDRTLAKYYKVLFADIYTLTANTIPQLDIVNLFHLCEFYMHEDAPFIHQNDESLVQLFLDKLNPDGKILFYTRSFAWNDPKFSVKSYDVVKSFEESGKIKLVDKYKSLLIYTKA